MSHINQTDYFSLFGLKQCYSQDVVKIRECYLKLQQKIHPDHFVESTPQEKRLAVEYTAIVNEGYRTLCDPLKRAIYLLTLHGLDTQSETDTSMPMDFLMEQMSLREHLAELKNQAAPEKAHIQLRLTIDEMMQNSEKQLSGYLDAVPPKLLEARMSVRKMQFYARLLSELS